MIEIFTDASVNKETTIATCFCIDDKMFIGHRIFENKDIHKSQLGELFGAVNAIKYVQDRIEKDAGPIILYTDSQFLIDLLTTDISWHDDEYSEHLFYDYTAEFRSLVNQYSIDVKLITGHQMKHNPNKVVDLISVNTLRNTV